MNCFIRVRVLIAVPICRHGTKMESYPTEQLWILCLTVRSFFWIRNYTTNWSIFIDGFNVYQHRHEVIYIWKFPLTVRDHEEIFCYSCLQSCEKSFVNWWLISKHTHTWLSVGADSQLWPFVSALSVHCVCTMKGLHWYRMRRVGLRGLFRRPPGLGTIPHGVLI